MWSPTAWDDVTAALNTLSEGDDLDFKDGRALTDSREVAKDISAMSIYGGTLAYGIDEKDELAVGHSGVPLGGQVNRVQQIADTAVRPPLDLDIRALEDPSQAGHGVLIVVVPASPSAPHMAGDRYPARSGTTTRYLSEPEVERLYEQRREAFEGASGRTAFNDYRHPGGFVPSGLRESLGVLSLYLEPVAPQSHPQGARLSTPLSEAVRSAAETISAYVKPDSSPALLDELDRWRPEGTIGWTAGATFDPLSADLAWYRLGVPAAATYTHAGNFSFKAVTAVVLEVGQRCAYEHVWAVETMAALAIAGSFYSNIPGVSLAHVDLGLEGLKGTRTARLFQGRTHIRDPLEVRDDSYYESGTFAVRELAKDPRDATRDLLDRLFASFLGDTDVVAELA